MIDRLTMKRYLERYKNMVQLDEHYIDDFLCLERHLDLSMELGEYKINIVPHKAHFLVTVYKDGIEEKQEWFNTWMESLAKFNEFCRYYGNVVMYDRLPTEEDSVPSDRFEDDPYTDYGGDPNDDIAW